MKNAACIMAFMLITCFIMAGCSDDVSLPDSNEPLLKLSVSKARYVPGERVEFFLEGKYPPTARVRYKHLNNTLEVAAIQAHSWSWKPPADDFKGYMAEIYEPAGDQTKTIAAIGFDVSSDWSRFPRYGFLSGFSDAANTHDVIDQLNRFHINGIVFSDWQYRFHKPLPLSPPDRTWKNMAGQDVFLETIKDYIGLARERNMTTMFSNLANGTSSNAASDGVLERWYLFKDDKQERKDTYLMPQPPYTSDIFLMNPANLEWQQYLAQKNHEVYDALDFDGWHVEQLGNRGVVYDYNGNLVPLETDFNPFINFMKSYIPRKKIVFDAPNQFGQYAIAQTNVEFLYTAVRPPNESYADLGRIILDNHSFSNQTKKTVLAAHVHYNLTKNQDYFNTPAVLFTNAVIFALGGAHMEIGEHMLCSEYFSDSRLRIETDLIQSLTTYYDFLVAYQNLLRDKGSFNKPALVVVGRSCCVNFWPPQDRKIVLIGKEIGNRQVVHLINFLESASLDWADNSGDKKEPEKILNLGIVHNTNKTVKKVWFASPDGGYGGSVDLPFIQTDSDVVFNIPFLKYWSMIVIEF